MGTRGCGAARVALCAVIAVLSLAGPTSGAVTNPGCGADLSNKVTKFQTANLPCKNYGFPVSNPYVIWALRDNATNIATMVVSMPLSPSKWAGIAFSGDGQMPNSTALIATLSSTGAPVVKVYSLNDRSESEVVEDASKLTFVGGSPEGYYDQGRIVYVSFQVDFAKSLATPTWFLMAYGNLNADGTLDQHEARTFFKAEFASGVVAGDSAAASKLETRARVHGTLQIVGWGFLLPVGVMFARYARGFDPAWFYIHVAIQILGFVCIVLGVFTGFKLLKDFRPKYFEAHVALGLFLFLLVLLQVLALAWRPKKDAKIRKHWTWYHMGLGRFLLVMAMLNVALGLYIGRAEREFKLKYLILLTVELAAIIFLEIVRCRRGNRPSRVQHSPNQDPPAFQFGGSV